MSNFNKTDLIANVTAATGTSKQTVQAVIDAALKEISEKADAGMTVRLAQFGTFQVKESAARQGRNPRTGETVEIPAKRRLAFKASKSHA
ncbi:HU family DNA-binding protein [Acidimangrovimonas sediminis]|uniref:HU family DNA-binding protein n=1 Tax=Acidimangrovimonas sediminis TaxID=2056283 RepID=UPI000C80BA4F|nr:HU family DNA-binding protein [Acidimangrovimonas sediminis]